MSQPVIAVDEAQALELSMLRESFEDVPIAVEIEVAAPKFNRHNNREVGGADYSLANHVQERVDQLFVAMKQSHAPFPPESFPVRRVLAGISLECHGFTGHGETYLALVLWPLR